MARYIGFVFFGLASLCHVCAQVDTATISGLVRDQAGAVIPGARVVVLNTGTNQEVVAATGELGLYTVPQLKIGTYQVAVSHAGFKTEVRKGIVLNVQQVARVDFMLQIGDVRESVAVTAEAALIETGSASLGQVVYERVIKDLPLNGRNFLQLAKLSTGVLEPARGDRAAGSGSFSANGVRSTMNSFLLDGVDNNARQVDQQNASNVVIQPSVDAVQEFRVETSAYSAEFGQSAGAVINASIKSGTNAFHGTAFEFQRNDNVNARNFFSLSTAPKPFLLMNQFGGTLGGPVLRDRTFFFGSYEGTRELRGRTAVRTLPSAALRSGNFAGDRPIFDPATVRPNPAGSGFVRGPFAGNVIPAGRIDPVAVKIGSLLPAPNIPGATNNYSLSPNDRDSREQIDSRVDHKLSDRSSLFGRYSFMDQDIHTPGVLPLPLVGSGNKNDGSFVKRRANMAALGHSFILNPASLHDLRIGWNRIRDDLTGLPGTLSARDAGFKNIPQDPRVSGLPQIGISGFTAVGEAAFIPNLKISEIGSLNDSLALIRGSHSLKMGANLRWLRNAWTISGQARGQFNLSGVFTQNPLSRATSGSGYADFLLGLPASSSLSNITPGDIRNYSYAFYVQDDWKITPRLTFLAGLRWEVFTQPIERHDQQANFLPEQGRLVYARDQIPDSMPPALVMQQPRGLATRSIVRNDYNNLAPRLGLTYTLTRKTVLRTGAGVFYGDHPFIGALNRLPSQPPYRMVTSYPTDQVYPVITFASGFPQDALAVTEKNFPNLQVINWDPDFPQNYVYHWSFNIQHDTPWFLVDAGYSGAKGTQQTVEWDLNSPRAGPGSVASRRPFPANGTIMHLQPMGNSTYHAFLLRLERRFANGFGFLTSYTVSKSLDWGGDELPSGDRAYRDVTNIRLDRGPALFDMRQRLVTSFLWDLPFGSDRRYGFGAGVLNVILGNWQLNGITTLRTGSPFTPSIGFSSANTGHSRPDRIADGRLPAEQRSIQRWFDKSAFKAAQPYLFGNAGRNILYSPGAVNVDGSLFKRFRLPWLGEAGELQTRLEAFNLFNTPHFGYPNDRVDLPQGGTITGLRGTMRELQFGAKIIF